MLRLTVSGDDNNVELLEADCSTALSHNVLDGFSL